MPTLNRKLVRLCLLALVGGLLSCKTPGGPFVTVNITGVPKETTKLMVTAVLLDTSRPGETTPSGGGSVQLTIDLPPGARGTLMLSGKALLDPACMLANGTAEVMLSDDTAYEATLALMDAPLAGCMGISTLTLTLNKTEMGATGTVSSTPAGIDCGAGCTQTMGSFRPGTQVTLVARPALGSHVTWSDASCNPYRVCTVTLSQSMSETATFAPCAKGTWCDGGAPDVTSDLYSVWGIGSGTIYAVGAGGSIALGNGTQWAAMSSGVTTALRTVGGDYRTKTVYAGGDGGTLLNLTGTVTWTVLAEPLVAGKQIAGIMGESNMFFNPRLNVYLATADGGFFLKSGSGSWTAINDGALANKVLHAVAANNTSGGREATVVGDGGFALRYTATVAGQQTADNTSGSMATTALRAVWTGSGLSVAVGDGGVIITRGTQDYGNLSKNWKLVPSGVTTPLRAVWGGDDSNIWIVGDGGVILKYDGNNTVTKQTGVPAVDLTGVWAADNNPANVYAVGKHGLILHYLP